MFAFSCNSPSKRMWSKTTCECLTQLPKLVPVLPTVTDLVPNIRASKPARMIEWLTKNNVSFGGGSYSQLL